ncbi:MAG: substrate-binding domain-containing protein [Trueperaceae bacterium]|nr:substrate-binding domain-containing protein [Trueperaceae bacterium]
MSRTARTLLFAVAILGLVGGAAFAQGTPQIGLSTINLQALFFNQINDGALDAANQFGAEVQIVDSNNDPDRQVRAIESFITQQKDAIIVVAIDVNGIVPALQAARDAGIPVVAIDAQVASPPANTFIGVDNYGAGRQAGEYTLAYINDELGGTAKVGIVGALNSFIQNLRRDGFVEVLTGVDGIEIVNVVDGQNQQEIALTAAENLMTGTSDLDIVYATGEPALIGSIAAVESQGRTETVRIIGWDLTAQAVRGIEQGFVQAVVQQNPYQEGFEAVRASLEMIAGNEVGLEILIPIDIVTVDNVDDFRYLFE